MNKRYKAGGSPALGNRSNIRIWKYLRLNKSDFLNSLLWEIPLPFCLQCLNLAFTVWIISELQSHQEVWAQWNNSFSSGVFRILLYVIKQRVFPRRDVWEAADWKRQAAYSWKLIQKFESIWDNLKASLLRVIHMYFILFLAGFQRYLLKFRMNRDFFFSIKENEF